VTVLAPHSEGVAGSESEGVTLSPFRYAPAPFETVGYSRSLQADERLRGRAALAAPLYLLGARRAVARELRRRRYDLVHAHWIVPNGLAAAAALPERDARGERVAFAIGLHGSDVFLAEKPGVRRLTRWALSRAALLTGCSPELVDRVCALGFPAARARVISYGVDVRAFTPGRGRGLPDGGTAERRPDHHGGPVGRLEAAVGDQQVLRLNQRLEVRAARRVERDLGRGHHDRDNQELCEGQPAKRVRGGDRHQRREPGEVHRHHDRPLAPKLYPRAERHGDHGTDRERRRGQRGHFGRPGVQHPDRDQREGSEPEP